MADPNVKVEPDIIHTPHIPLGVISTVPYSLPANAEPELVHAVVAAAHRAAPIDGQVITNETRIEPLDPEAAAGSSAPVAPVAPAEPADPAAPVAPVA